MLGRDTKGNLQGGSQYSGEVAEQSTRRDNLYREGAMSARKPLRRSELHYREVAKDAKESEHVRTMIL